MAESRTLQRPDGRTVGFVDYGPADGTAVVWCHGGPGSRLEPASVAAAAADSGFRIIGIDRPGYGLSTPQPGRSISTWTADALAVLDATGVERAVAVGVSTGGAYALALAARAPTRVVAVVACCALTDMRWREGKAMMPAPSTAGIWGAPNREAAIALATQTFGADGSNMMAQAASGPPMPAADLAMLQDPAFAAGWAASTREMFAFSVQGYVDDRLADGVGWGSFDVSAIRCPVAVIHGAEDPIVPVAHAHHTASIVPGATTSIVPALGHFSIIGHVLPTLRALVPNPRGASR